MILVKVNGRSYKTFCACDKMWNPAKAFCYGDDKCKVCGFYPWAVQKKNKYNPFYG